MYFSWTWLFWPWFVAISLAFYGLYCFYKHSLGEASIFEQLALVTSVFTWLTLVPPAHFNGYLEGWPFVFFFVYHYFFFFNVSVRKRLYGDYFARPHDPKWDVNPPKWYRLVFCVGVMVSHWLAAFEGPELHLIPGGWSNAGIWILIVVTLLMQYNSTLYLAKYSEKVVVPTAVVQFGPYSMFDILCPESKNGGGSDDRDFWREIFRVHEQSSIQVHSFSLLGQSPSSFPVIGLPDYGFVMRV
ncbi:hypothetical protein GH714_035403 [Hevea brasiliensis]|uniref:Uncharacterized protein n=1 Tax=Hevea brasiliensis TaxID=3981 RepID=A0A6A6KS06_HEVBR|nr:hypothetical protein GH714_035403 [Hevea brasiliensis]